jgi:DNA-binding beta-propeller fold protein YncE
MMMRKLILAAAVVGAVLALPSGSNAAPFVYVGSGDYSDNVFQFNAGPGGLLAPLSPPSVISDQRPMRLAVSPDGRSLYVVNSGAYEDGDPGYRDEGDTVSQYDIGADGRLTPKSPPAVAAGDLPSDIAISPDGKSVYVPNSVSEQVLQYNVGSEGRLSLNSSAPAPVDWGVAVAVSPDGQSVYVVAGDNEVFGGDSTVYQYDVGPGGVLSPKSPPTIDAGDRPIDVAVSPDGKSVYVVNIGVFYSFPSRNTASVSQYNVASDGTLSPKSPASVHVGHQAVALAVSPDGRSVYVVNQNGGSGAGGPSDSVYQFDVRASGALESKSPFAVAARNSPHDIAVSPDGKTAYVTFSSSSGGSRGVLQYAVGAGGRLSLKNPATVPAGSSPAGIAVSPVPTAKAQCKHGRWKQFGFKNQGRCIRFLKHGPK